MATTTTTPANDFPALEGRTVTQGHADVCATRGHATHTVAGVAQSECPRCGEHRIPARVTVLDVFAGRPEARTSYGNQRALAARDLGPTRECIHGDTLADGCPVCRMSGSVLVLA